MIHERNVELFLNFVASLLLHTTDRLVVGGETKVQLIKYKTFLQIPPKRYFIVQNIKLFCMSRQEETTLFRLWKTHI